MREYPASVWACTKEEFDPEANDVFSDWRVKYRGDPFAVMNTASWEDQVANKMFMRLFKYIVGVNSEGKEIKMTRPVTSKREVTKETFLTVPLYHQHKNVDPFNRS